MSYLGEQHDYSEKITYKEILSFYIPLGLTTLIIPITHSLFNAGLAKLHNPEIYIAAFAVAKSLHNLIQSPVGLLKQAFTSLVEDRESYKKLKIFAFCIFFLVFLIYALAAFTGISRFVFGNIMGVKGKTLEAAVIILRILVFFPVFITLREFGQGVAIKLNSTPLITFATLCRVLYVFIFTLVITKINLSPAVIVGLMFLGAIIAEGLVLSVGNKLSIGNIVLKIQNRNSIRCSGKRKLSAKEIVHFCLPLLAMNYIKTFAVPIINMRLARAANPDMAISAYAVAWGLATIIFGPLTLYHQVSINYNSGISVAIVRRFTVITGLIITTIFGLISFTPLGYLIFTKLIGTSAELSSMSSGVLKVLTLLPVVMIIKEYYWGRLMKARLTQYVGKGKFINIISLSLVVFSLSFIKFNNPALIGAIAMISGTAIEAAYLYQINRGVLSKRISKD